MGLDGPLAVIVSEGVSRKSHGRDKEHCSTCFLTLMKIVIEYIFLITSYIIT